MTKLSNKKLESLIDSTFKKYSHGVQINIMDLSAIMQKAKQAYQDGLNLDDTMKHLVNIYKVN
jgi:hypothetical protein